MSSIKIIFQKLPASELDFQEKLKSITAATSQAAGDREHQSAIHEIQALKIKNGVIGPHHFAFLTEGTDGRICRVGFSMHPSLLSKEPRREKDPPPSYSASAQYDVLFARRQARHPPSRHRSLIAAGRIRPGGAGGSARGGAVDESLAVPEERIQQCQVVLAGKSRDIIKRELQRTNLDVNMAINNILSRDDGEEPPSLGAGSIGSLIQSFQHSEEIFNLIDDPQRGGDVLDSILGRNRSRMIARGPRGATGGRGGGQARTAGGGDVGQDKLEIEPPLKRFRATGGTSGGGNGTSKHRDGNKKGDSGDAENIHFGIVEWWPQTDVGFVQLVSLHNEILALDAKGRLHQWQWGETLSYTCPNKPDSIFHPKTEQLGLVNEEVTAISGAVCRASFVTKTHKLGTLCDSSLGSYGRYFEQKATLYPDFGAAAIGASGKLHTCSQWTLIQVKNELYWWGVIPYEQRAKALEKLKKSQSKVSEELTVGAAVTLKKQPVYRAGTKAIKLLDNEPKIGELTQEIHKIDCDAKVEFRIIEDEQQSGLKSSRKRTYSDSKRNPLNCEKWKMNRVIFFPDDGDEITGKVIRIDGDICVVSFDKETNNQQQLSITSDKVRIVHKDDLCLAAKHNAQIDVVARTPRKVTTPTGSRILTADIDEEGIVHTILAYPAKDGTNQGKIQYGKYDLNKADATPHLVTLPTTVASFNAHSHTPQIDHTFGDCPVILLDALRVHHPLFFNAAGLLQDPEWFWLGLPPITALSSSIYNMPQFVDPKRDKAFVALVVFKRQILMPLVLANYGHLVKVILDVLTEKYAEFESLIETLYAEIIDGQRNILHAAIDGQLKSSKKDEKKLDIDPCLLGMGEPLPKQRQQSNSQQELALANVIDAIQTLFDANMAQTLQHLILAKSTPSATQERTSVIKKTDALTQASTGSVEQSTSNDGDIFWGSAELSRLQQKYPFEPDESPVEHLFALAPKHEPVLTVLLNASLIEVQLNNLLEQRDAFGRTPFMYAIHRRSYAEGNALFTKALELAAQTDEEEAALQKYIYPVGSPPDLNPLYVLCCNDTCSFTWTKDKHINQDIYECKTCGLTESLCCCSECARTCHAGHDCVLKKTSPTAYCDCLEKCPCAAQEEGDQESRASLLEALLTHSSLVEQTTSRGEHLLQFLAQTVARQVKEQAQKLDIDAKGGPRPKTMGGSSSDDHKDAPPIAPPTFCRSALTRVLRDWRAVNSLIMNDRDPLCASSSKSVPVDDQTLLKGQNGSARLDKFTHTLLLKLTASEYLSSLIGTIQAHEDQSPHVAARFVRSVIRVFVCFASGMAPQTTEKQLSTLNKAKQIFVALPAHATKSLCLAAESLVKPMRLGAVRPVESFTPGAEADEVIKTTEELFSTGPMVPRRDRKTSARNRHRGRSENQPIPPPRTNSTRRWRDELQELTGMNQHASTPRQQPVRQSYGGQQQDDIQTDASDDEEMDVQENVEEEEMFVEQNLINGEEDDDDDVEMDSQDNQDENQPVDIDGEETDEVEEDENEDNEIMDDFGADDDNNEAGVGLLPDEVELDEFEQQEEEEDGFGNDQFEEDDGQSAGSAATYDIGFAHSENEDDGSIDGFEVQSGFGSGQDEDERNSGRGGAPVDSPQYSPSSPTSHLASHRWGQSRQQSGQRRGQATTTTSSTAQPWSMSWAVREMPAERSSNRRNRWPDQDMSQYIMLNPDNQPPIGRSKRSTVSGMPTMCSITETQARLARSAALCIKEAASLLKPEVLEPLEPKQRVDMIAQVENVLQPIWNWVLVIMDWTESQLRYGASLNKAGELRYSKSEAKQAKKPVKSHDYLTYALSLLRQGSSEHSDVLPSIDISSLKHIAYVLDSMVYLFKQDLSLCTVEQAEPANASATTTTTQSPRTGPRNTFFRRSESMLFLGANEDETFELSNAESLPLSEQPHLLKPSSTKEELFGRTGKSRENQPTGLDMQTTMALGVTHDMAKQGYLSSDAKVGADGLLNRWRKSVELFARVFMDDVGSEDGSILRQLASFSLRQQKFTKQMEYLRQSVKQSELKIEVHRPREKLIPETVKKLNHEYQKLKDMRPQREKYKQMDPLGGENPALWGGTSGGGGGVERGATPTNPRTNTPLMVSRKIKVRFFDEPGEGNGVMRSFFTTIADCLLAPERLPPMDHTQQNNEPPTSKSSDAATTLRRSGLSGLSRMGRHHRWKEDNHKLDVASDEWTPETAQRESDARYKYKMKIYDTAKKDFGANAAKLTGVLSSMSSGQFMNCMNDDEQLKLKILEASKLLKDAHKWKGEQGENEPDGGVDDKPLFFLPSAKQRYYAVEPGNVSMERLNVFRNVGRVIGLALLHNELCPIPLSRSVVKQILGRKVNWHDLAFYDADLFESLRKLIHQSSKDPDYLKQLDMTFEIVDSENQTVELIPGGKSLPVTNDTIYDYVRRYATYKMVTKPAPAIKEMRYGVHDVISEAALNGLTPEDWWLLVNGVGTVDVAKLAAMTSFNDESSLTTNDNLVKRFESWFWEVVNSFTQAERQELLYFWTGAPALRAGEEAFEPAPSITIRHPNDISLPSANTCISRLYLPLYSSKAILKAKLSMAIKTKSFGFV